MRHASTTPHVNVREPLLALPENWPTAPHWFSRVPQGLRVLGRFANDPATSAEPVGLASETADVSVSPPVREIDFAPFEAIAGATTETVFTSADAGLAELNLSESRANDVALAADTTVTEQQDSQHNHSQLQRSALPFQSDISLLVSRLSRSLRWNKNRIWQWHLVGGDRASALCQLWAMAHCWVETRPQSLLLIDAISGAAGLGAAWGWQANSGWSEVIAEQKSLESALCATPWSRLALLPRGVQDWTGYGEETLRLSALVAAVQRDFPAVWIVTGGEWNGLCDRFAALAHERQLMVSLADSHAAADWQLLQRELVARNVMINGWLGVGAPPQRQIA